jgi:insulysin
MQLEGSNIVLNAPLPNPNQANSALSYFTYYGPVTDQKSRVTSALLTQILSEPAFNVLRTREQLGYLVSCTNWTLSGLSERGLRIVVQSEKKPGYLEERVEAFLDEMRSKLEMMADAEFVSHRTALEKKWLEADKNLPEEVARYIVQVNSGHCDFLRSKKPIWILDPDTDQTMLR